MRFAILLAAVIACAGQNVPRLGAYLPTNQAISPAGIVSGAASDAPPASGSLVSIYGSNLGVADAVVAAAGFPLPFVLGGLSLFVNNQPVPLAAGL